MAKTLAAGGLSKSVYFHPGHTWASFQPNGVAKIGLDRFLRDFLGKFEEIIVPSVGRRIKQGQPIFTIVSGGKQVHVVSPLDGVVVDANLNPADGLEYKADHMLTIRPTRIDADLRSMKGYEEAENWLVLEYARFKDFIACNMNPFKGMGVTLADGGFHVDGILEKMDKETLETFNEEFLHC